MMLATGSYTAEEEAEVVRKFDRKLVLFVALLYMLSFLDRSSTSPILSLPTRCSPASHLLCSASSLNHSPTCPSRTD